MVRRVHCTPHMPPPLCASLSRPHLLHSIHSLPPLMHHLLCIMYVSLHIAMQYCILRVGLYMYMKQAAYGPLHATASIYYVPYYPVCPTICTPFCPTHSIDHPFLFVARLTCAAFLCNYLPSPSATICQPSCHPLVSTPSPPNQRPLPIVSFTIACWLRPSDGPCSLFNGSMCGRVCY